MRSYSEREVFSPAYVRLWRLSTQMVDALPMSSEDKEIRCHELSRAIHQKLTGYYDWRKMDVVDGKFGAVDHSWIVLDEKDTILDTYAVGALPQVQLIHNWSLLPHWDSYKAGSHRDDIREGDVMRMVKFFTDQGF